MIYFFYHKVLNRCNIRINYFLFICFISLSASLIAGIKTDGIIKIEIGERTNKDISHESKLDQRIWRLESAVIQLQRKVFKLEYENDMLRMEKDINNPTEVKEQYTYYIKTPFSGTHYGKGDSPAEAKAKALKACEKASTAFWCSEEKLKSD